MRENEKEFLKSMMTKEQGDKENFWQNELRSLGIAPKRKNELNDKEELEALAYNIKQVYYQQNKTAYDDDNEKVDSDAT